MDKAFLGFLELRSLFSYLFRFQHLETGLHIAAWHGFPRIVEILCQAGASVNIKNEVGTSIFICNGKGSVLKKSGNEFLHPTGCPKKSVPWFFDHNS